MKARRKTEDRTIIFCQGDKLELEEMTGQKYDYVLPKGTIPHAGVAEHTEMCLDRTFLEVQMDKFKEDPLDELRKWMRGVALRYGADAVIHYQPCIYLDQTGATQGFAHGTFLRRKSR